MKRPFLILIIFLLTSNLYSQECDEPTIARMIKSGISDKTIEDQCGKIGEKEKVSEIVENENSGEEGTVAKNVVIGDKDEIKSIRVSIGGAYGSFKYSDSFNT